MEFLLKLEAVLKERKEQLPEKSYTANLFRDGEDRILKKITEEAGEVLLASKNHDHKESGGTQGFFQDGFEELE